MDTLQETFRSKGMVQITDTAGVKAAEHFLVDSFGEDRFSAYPLREEEYRVYIDSKHEARLYGTHWKYTINREDWNDIAFKDGDAERVLEDIRRKVSIGEQPIKRSPVYMFNRRKIESGELWRFQEGTKGWDYCEEVLLPKFRDHWERYSQKKERLERGED